MAKQPRTEAERNRTHGSPHPYWVGAALLLGGMALGFAWRALRAERTRGQMRHLLHRREEDFNATFENAAIGIAHTGMDGRWLRVNRKLCEILGYPREELMKLRFQDVTHPDDVPLNLILAQRLMSGEIPEFTMEKRYISKDGRIIWGNVTCALLRGPHGRRRYCVVTVEDITARKEAEEEVARQKNNAEAATRAKDHLLSMISHELRTPLTPVLAALSEIEARNPTEKETLSIIRRNIEHEVGLVDDLLDVTRLGHGKLRLQRVPLNLHDLIREVWASIRTSLEGREIGFHLHLEAAHPVVRGDAARLRQVLLNLLDNARKYTPPGGQITLSTEEKGDEIVVRVSDTGTGISPENMERIFQAFEQGESPPLRQHGGLGLGLTITRGLVEGHGGRLVLEESRTGKGTTFSFTLPREIALPLPVTEAATGPGDSRPRRRILLIEDHADTRETLQRLLQKQGYEVCTAASISAAIAAVQAEPFDLFVSDLGLPDGSGLDLPNTLARAAGRSIPCVALSGYGTENEIDRSLRAGYSMHLTKPVDLTELAAAIARTGRTAS